MELSLLANQFERDAQVSHDLVLTLLASIECCRRLNAI